ncbi:MAG TPA: hypothetical protein VM580_33935 [Labilithrix sp.]|nr:hypothetical protein [Labilithrix sp.]
MNCSRKAGAGYCPAGYIDDGAFCRRDAHIFAKNTYGRGAGSPMSCAPGLEEDAGLCYAPCPIGFDGVGPVCWKSDCPPELPLLCGAGCAKDVATCVKATANQTLKSVQFISSLIQEDWVGAITDGIAAANAFNVPICR